jgi:hypothetical protein
MTSLEYQRRLAEFDERIWFHKTKADMLEHKKSQFVLECLSITQRRDQEEHRKKFEEEEAVEVIKRNT